VNPVTGGFDLDHRTAVIDTETTKTIAIKESKMSLLQVELTRERVRDLEREVLSGVQASARVHIARRARRDVRGRALLFRNILLGR
jgi:GTP1/Obg family GTP-binding protein